MHTVEWQQRGDGGWGVCWERQPWDLEGKSSRRWLRAAWCPPAKGTHCYGFEARKNAGQQPSPAASSPGSCHRRTVSCLKLHASHIVTRCARTAARTKEHLVEHDADGPNVNLGVEHEQRMIAWMIAHRMNAVQWHIKDTHTRQTLDAHTLLDILGASRPLPPSKHSGGRYQYVPAPCTTRQVKLQL